MFHEDDIKEESTIASVGGPEVKDIKKKTRYHKALFIFIKIVIFVVPIAAIGYILFEVFHSPELLPILGFEYIRRKGEEFGLAIMAGFKEW